MTLDDSPKRTDEYPGEQNLIALGATLDPDMPHCWWLNGHCFLVTEAGIDEL
jgi:hypothetical protein